MPKIGIHTDGAFTIDPISPGNMAGSGEIEIEEDRWQLIAIPVQYGYWDAITHKHVHDSITVSKVKNYFLDQIEDIMGGAPETFIEVCNCYIGDNDSFFNFVPGLTNPLSTHNFPLVYEDGARLEVTGFWVRSIHPTPIVVSWGE